MLADKQNGFLEKLFLMLESYFLQCKKFLTEKNAKLEVTFKMRQKKRTLQSERDEDPKQRGDGEDSDDNLMEIEDSFSDEDEEGDDDAPKPTKQLSPE